MSLKSKVIHMKCPSFRPTYLSIFPARCLSVILSVCWEFKLAEWGSICAVSPNFPEISHENEIL